jgi:hypothetical protein
MSEKESMPSNTYLPTTWYDPRAEVRPSSIHAMGMFATQPIHEGEIVVRIGGTVMSEEKFRAYISSVSRYNAVQISASSYRPGGLLARLLFQLSPAIYDLVLVTRRSVRNPQAPRGQQTP